MRFIFYLIILLSFAASVYFKAQVIEAKSKKEIVSIFDEWKKNGLPVDIAAVKQGSMLEKQYVSGILREGNVIDAYVDERVIGRLRTAQKFSAVINKRELNGFISHVGITRQLNSGLFNVRLQIRGITDAKPGTIITCEVIIGKRYTTYIPSMAVLKDKTDSFCWVVSDGKVSKRMIKTGFANGQTIEVTKGLKPGEQVCVNGLVELKQNSKVKVRRLPMQ